LPARVRRYGLRPDRSEVEKKWDPLPSATLRSRNGVFGDRRLIEALDQQARFIDRVRIGMKWPMCADERHFEAIANDGVFIELLLEVRTVNNEWAVHRIALETAG
jgi:hypothetical protein